MRKLLLVLFLLAVWQSVKAADFLHINTENSGLSYDGISTIMQDSRGFVWIGTQKGLNRYDGYSMKAYYKEEMKITSDFIYAIEEDKSGNLWIGTDQGVTVYDYYKNDFIPIDIPSDKGTYIKNKVTSILVDNDGLVWMLVNNQGVFCHNPGTADLRHIPYEEIGMSGFRRMVRCPDGDFYISKYHSDLYHTDSLLMNIRPVLSGTKFENYFTGDEIEGLFLDDSGLLYIVSVKKGLSVYNPERKSVKNIYRIDNDVLINDAFYQKGKSFWLCTSKGVYKYDVLTGKSEHIFHDADDEFSITDNYVYSTFVDRNGGIWIGTKDNGLNYSGQHQTRFEKQYFADDIGLHGAQICGFAEDDEGFVWVATEEKGLLKYDPRIKKTSFVNNRDIPQRVFALDYGDGYLWIGTSDGIIRMDTGTGKIKKYGSLKGRSGPYDPNVYTVYVNWTGDIYAATTLGMFRYDHRSDSFREISAFRGKFCNFITSDKEYPNILWVSTYADGVLKWDSVKREITHYNSSTDSGIKNDKIYSTFTDSRSQVWVIGFSNGVSRLDTETGKFNKVQMPGLSSDVFFRALEDAVGNIWFTTDKGLVEYDTENGYTHVYTERDGILSQVFTKSSLKSSSGDLYFGSRNGFIRFNPNTSVVSGTDDINIVISAVRVGDKEVKYDTNPDLIKEISFEHNRNSFGFDFSILGLGFPCSNRICCRLKGLETEWYDIVNKRSVFYYNVPNGRYDLEFRISSKNGWQEGHAPLHIVVKPPFWSSVAGIMIITLMVLTFTLLCIYYVQKRTLKKKEKEAEEFRKQKEEETFKEKMNFFSHVIHEIKTPLTLIKTPLSNVIGKECFDDEARHDLAVMENNANYLTRLVNELLDYIRIERMGFALKCENIDIVERLRSILFNYSDTARNNNIRLEFECEYPGVVVYADSAALDKIINNLLLNAVKYAESFIRIEVDVDGQNLKIRFINDGAVIPQELRSEIFKPFVQYGGNNTGCKSGVGIGLPLARNLARIHRGDVSVSDSERTCFILTLPVLALSEQNPENDRAVSGAGDEPDSDRETVLVVDDNFDFREYLSSKLTDSYNVLSASDGKAAYQIIKERNVDMIVSDVSMPDMSGIELCRMVRKEIELSHLPIIIISARVSVESKIQAMEAGADLYVEKPFDLDYLRSSIKNIFDKRALMKNAFGSGLVKTDINLFGLPKKDEEFFTKFDSVIRENIGNGDFSNEMLARELNMSESTMLRKIKKLLNVSPSSYIKTVRLSVAAEMLKESHGNNVTEISYMVGFSSVSYFAKCFREQYGMTPSEYVERQ